MKPYEEILGKIAPIFYKFLQYHNSFAYYYSNFIEDYLINAKLIRIYHVNLLLSNNISYLYDIAAGVFIKYEIIVRLTTRNNVDYYAGSYFDEIIINTVINKFSFNNDKMVFYGGKKLDITYKDLFIALVGKDTYDTIQRNIK